LYERSKFLIKKYLNLYRDYGTHWMTGTLVFDSC